MPAHLPRKPLMGRASIFREKKGERVNGKLTVRGSVRFELHRRQLGRLVGLDPEHVSDADTVEYMARGEQETREYLAHKG